MNAVERIRREERADLYRKGNQKAERWAKGYGAIEHTVETQARVFAMAETLAARFGSSEALSLFDLLHGADRAASAAMWIVVHETYARNVYLDGRELRKEDFKPIPEGHTGGALNMVPAYVGYMAANAITGTTRSWIMGQGHSVAAIDTVNVLLDNMSEAHERRYSVSDEGLTRYVRDFYSYRIGADGKQDSPLGSHVNVHTAGGISEGGYLGFTELQYVHMPLPGERLVAFLSDGAFEEQRGSDWVPRWWRFQDSGMVAPIMIKNGRRIDQRTTMSQQGGADWFEEHLKLNSFDPIIFDGRDPAAFAWAIFEMEERLTAASEAVKRGENTYPVRLPYGIALAPKGAGFYGEGTNLAHNLPLMANPSTDTEAARHFNESARRLWVPPEDLKTSIEQLQNHGRTGRPRERDHALANREVRIREFPEPVFRPVPDHLRDRSCWTRTSPMGAVDSMFVAVLRANPHLRPRVGNPDEMRSNRLIQTLEYLKFRVSDPEIGIPEDIHGGVITALNEEAVASAALANKGGINLMHTYEAFGPKMHGVIRQEIIFTDHSNQAGRMAGWLSVPLLLTSHTWENGKNERSHQDPSMAEAMLGEPSDVSRVLFVPDYNTASWAMHEIYGTHGQIWTMVVPKADGVADLFTEAEAANLLRYGAIRVEWSSSKADVSRVILTALGAYQLEEVLKASERLHERGVPHSVISMLEPGRLRPARSNGERAHRVPEEYEKELYPDAVAPRVFVGHIRPEILLGTLADLHTGRRTTRGLGFINHGGTLSTSGMLFVNRCSWCHILREVADVLGVAPEGILTGEEMAVLEGKMSPEGIVWGRQET
ncbi:MAG TPA: xylulose 5-phosphate 3-epimerase [Deltaproteobacteria bacterium]|nr:xylulose 5-phosphate 3-epimerase [Deltaproteobacteria bacterium]